MLQIASVRAPCAFAWRSAISVSIVSPDCEIAMTRVSGSDDGVAVAELAGELDLDRQSRPVLDRVLRHQAGVGGGTAGDHDDLVDLAQHALVEVRLVQLDAVTPC